MEDEEQGWQRVEVNWYIGEPKWVRLLSGVSLWHTHGELPVPIRWVLVMDPEGKARSEAFFSTNTELVPQQNVEWFVLRWNVEVTFSDVLAFVRRAIWAGKYLDNSRIRDDQVVFSLHEWDLILDQLASAA